MNAQVYIGTILMERNRWQRDRTPSYRVSEWLPRFAAAGFAGMELWENHAAMATAEELAALTDSAFPVAIYNSYVVFDADADVARLRAVELAKRLRAGGVKFNLGKEPGRVAEYVAQAQAWQARFPATTRLLCECHAGTVMEDPESARQVFAEWDSPQFQAIVHPFTTEPDVLKQWFACLGSRITHAHVQLRDEQQKCRGLSYNPQRVREALHIMREEGFAGTFTLEFTEGTGTAADTPENMFREALSDLALLREELARLA